MHIIMQMIFGETAGFPRQSVSAWRETLQALGVPVTQDGIFTRFEFTDGITMACLIASVGDTFATLSLVAHLPGDDTGWDGWSQEKETKRLEFQAAWLKERGIREDATGPVQVTNLYDERSGAASITVTYDTP